MESPAKTACQPGHGHPAADTGLESRTPALWPQLILPFQRASAFKASVPSLSPSCGHSSPRWLSRPCLHTPREVTSLPDRPVLGLCRTPGRSLRGRALLRLWVPFSPQLPLCQTVED